MTNNENKCTKVDRIESWLSVSDDIELTKLTTDEQGNITIHFTRQPEYHPNQRLDAARREMHFFEFTELKLSDCRPAIKILSMKYNAKPLKCKCGSYIFDANELRFHIFH